MGHCSSDRAHTCGCPDPHHPPVSGEDSGKAQLSSAVTDTDGTTRCILSSVAERMDSEGSESQAGTAADAGRRPPSPATRAAASSRVRMCVCPTPRRFHTRPEGEAGKPLHSSPPGLHTCKSACLPAFTVAGRQQVPYAPVDRSHASMPPAFLRTLLVLLLLLLPLGSRPLPARPPGLCHHARRYGATSFPTSKHATTIVSSVERVLAVPLLVVRY